MSLNFRQMKQGMGLLTGHRHLNGHLFNFRLVNSPTCERCDNEEEMALHILYNIEALAELKLHHLETHFMKPYDYHKAL